MSNKATAIRIQEFAVPALTESDHRAVDRGYRAFFARRGIDVDRQAIGSRFLTAAERQEQRRKMAALYDETEAGE